MIKRRSNKMRSSFTMIEMVFVVVITGLVSVAGSRAIIQIMENYAIQKEYGKLELDSTSTIRHISKLLQNSIWDSIAIRTGNNYNAISNTNSINNGNLDKNRSLVFIEKNNDIINGKYNATSSFNYPLFSGFIDLSKSAKNIISSATPNIDDFISLQTDGSLSMHFPFVNAGGEVQNKFYNGVNNTAMFEIRGTNNALNIDGKLNKTITLNTNSIPFQIGDIGTIVNTTPTRIYLSDEENILGSDGQSKLIYKLKLEQLGNTINIAENVTSINIWTESNAGLIRLRICFNNKTMDFMPDFCKEGIIIK